MASGWEEGAARAQGAARTRGGARRSNMPAGALLVCCCITASICDQQFSAHLSQHIHQYIYQYISFSTENLSAHLSH
jgi:hypothetical protein